MWHYNWKRSQWQESSSRTIRVCHKHGWLPTQVCTSSHTASRAFFCAWGLLDSSRCLSRVSSQLSGTHTVFGRLSLLKDFFPFAFTLCMHRACLTQHRSDTWAHSNLIWLVLKIKNNVETSQTWCFICIFCALKSFLFIEVEDMLGKWWVVVIEFYLIFTMRARS